MHEAAVIMRTPCEADSRLPVVVVGRAGRNYAVPLHAPALHAGFDRATFEGAVFHVVSNAVVQSEVWLQLPGILNVRAVDIVGGVDLRRSDSNLELRRKSGIGRRSGEALVQAKVELREQREVREVAYVDARLHRMRAMRPREVVDVLVAV